VADRITEVLEQFAETRRKMVEELSKIIVGQRDVIDQIFAAIFTRGHCLLVGVPGLAKTLMVSSISKMLDLQFKRVQFTPDLMPTDILGTNILEEDEHGRRTFRFQHGPVFTNLLLADEINRTPPKTQAALLQSMQEREVTIGQTTYPLPEPFFVIATQNPIEQEGTYPLPEAQLDRFMFCVNIEYPTLDEEERILTSTTKGETAEIGKVLSSRGIQNLQKLILGVQATEPMIKYAARIVRATRPKSEEAPAVVKELVDWGAGPRAGQYLIMGAKAMAAMDGRYAVAYEDIRKVAPPVLRHRVSTNFRASAEGKSTDDVVRFLLETIPEPEAAKYDKLGAGKKR
jgi:MoxR-like ATPase